MQVEQRGSVREDRVDVDLLDVRQVGDGVLRKLEVTRVLDGAVLLVHGHHLRHDLVESIADFPEGLLGLGEAREVWGENVEEKDKHGELRGAS